MAAPKTQRPGRTVVGVSLHPDELAELDRQRARLGATRSRAMKLVWDHLGTDAADAVLARTAHDEAAAQSVQPLLDALAPLASSWSERAHQRQRIGVHTNQIAKLANALGIAVHNGERIDAADVERIASALESIDARLAQQQRAELADQTAVAAVRRMITDRCAA